MPLKSEEIEKLIKESMPDAEISIQDLAETIIIIQLRLNQKNLQEKSRIDQHKLVYKALKGKMGNELHALQLITIAK